MKVIPTKHGKVHVKKEDPFFVGVYTDEKGVGPVLFKLDKEDVDLVPFHDMVMHPIASKEGYWQLALPVHSKPNGASLNGSYFPYLIHYLVTGVKTGSGSYHTTFIDGDHYNYRKDNLLISYDHGKEKYTGREIINTPHSMFFQQTNNVPYKSHPADEDNALISYVKDKDHNKIGCVVALSPHHIGWSLCHKADHFSKATARNIAFKRAYNIPVEVSVLRSYSTYYTRKSGQIRKLKDYQNKFYHELPIVIEEHKNRGRFKSYKFDLLYKEILNVQDRAERYYK